MDIFFPGGIQLVLAIQSLGAWLEIPMKFFSFLGSEQFYLFILPALYWSVDTALGLRVGAVLLLNVGVNDIFKLALHAPRPYWFDPAVRPISAETSFGAPSGHAQLSAGVWGALAASIRKPWGWALAVALTFLIGFSRIYLGVHFLHDVVLGWALGALVLGVVLRVQEPLAHWLVKKTVLQQVGMALALSLMLVISGALARPASLPPEWTTNAIQAGAAQLPDPVTLDGNLTAAGALFGLLAGLAWMNTQGGFSAEGTTIQRLARYALGLVGVALFWFGLGALFPRGEALLPYILRFVRYSLIGFWISAGAPWFFAKLRLNAQLTKM
ncbi:MAG: phosphoesterase PA-phosphatase [Anaerolineae bacterium CG_4_9_14_3_um_filter_57_17]|nr:phosphatase PAP2 family protein [bacterium]NCT21878.1 phosphatase PAP2 family protein [bacterium]OIO85745.1 MAG: hypothetical protein AUK01_05305 [Anaerolineae bacterium CG2_30_57_67]PJB68348.1 MAG: phosphoesterase PA-phosphatase [Anaerolineae bacterium CG_4_9_14_3_um_filter_57_17]